MNEESLFAAALEKGSPAERRAFLDEVCAGDEALRQRVEQLLLSDAKAGGILESGPDAAMNSPGPSSVLAVDRLFGSRFKLRQKLGEGGMGEVWVADQIEPVQRRVALKVVRPGLDSARMLARFEQERQALALMDHPNIAKVLDAGVADGRPYFVMELIKGVPITKYCDDAKLSPRERLELFIPICQAVQHAHQKGIIHRDLKPTNIIVGLYDGKPVPKVIDFGVAKATGPRLTENSVYTEIGTLIGTLEYMSPEQAELNNLDVDTRSDIYTLGAILYELLTGSVPFSRQELQSAAFNEMLRMIKEVDPPRPSTRLSGSGTLPSVAAVRQTEPKKLVALIRGELDWIVVKCLEKDRSRRYETASGLALDLQRYLGNEPVAAGPPSAVYRLRKFVRRHRAGVAAVAAFILLLATAVVALTFALVAVNRERQQKEVALEAEGKRRRQARAALDAMSSKITEEWLRTQTVLLPQHKKFLEQALRDYEEFAADTGQQEESRAGVAGAHVHVAYIRQLLGEHKESEAALRRARELYAALVADFPGVPDYRLKLARVYMDLAILHDRADRLHDAQADFDQGLHISRGLVSDFPDVPSYRLTLAKSLDQRGILLKNSGRHQEAEETYKEALALLNRLVADDSTEPAYRDVLGETLGNLGVLLDRPKRSREAAEAFAQAVAIFQHLTTEVPKEPRYREFLAMHQDHLAGTLRDARRYSEAEQSFLQALKTRKQLVARFPGMPSYREGLAITLNNYGILLKNTERSADAKKLYGESLALHQQLAADFPEIPRYQYQVASASVNLARLLLAGHDADAARRLLEDAEVHILAALKANKQHPAYRNVYRLMRWRLAETLLELKDHAGAAVAAGEFLQTEVEPPRDAYTAASLFAGCARLAAQDERLAAHKRQELATTYGDKALSALRQAIDKGAKEVSQIAKDPSLDPLRSRQDFRKLLSEWEAKPRPQRP